MIKLVVFDWAGTTVDYGCMAPVSAFKEAFNKLGIYVSEEEIRKPMGMLKRDHIITMLEMNNVNEQFIKLSGRDYNDNDVDMINQYFEISLFTTLDNYVDIIPGTLSTIKELKSIDISIGSTTGYTSKMMDVVTKVAAANGYQPDFLSTADSAGRGRPYPNMIDENIKYFGVTNKESIKIGDTIVDIEEGVNAGCLTVGIIFGSSLLGLSKDQVANLCDDEKLLIKERITKQYLVAGADYVIDEIGELVSLVHKINEESSC